MGPARVLGSWLLPGDARCRCQLWPGGSSNCLDREDSSTAPAASMCVPAYKAPRERHIRLLCQRNPFCAEESKTLQTYSLGGRGIWNRQDLPSTSGAPFTLEMGKLQFLISPILCSVRHISTQVCHFLKIKKKNQVFMKSHQGLNVNYS